ncbi:MAG: hypothetical protein U1E48_14845 [Paracoccaceae bacterium]
MAPARRLAETDGRRALDHWLAQEESAEFPVGTDDLADLLAERRLPSGWWMLPALLLALPFWGWLIWMIMRT